jgi:hypothetical protein
MTDKQAGRPAPLGRKVPVGIRLTPDVLEFCKQHPDGFVFLETLCRKSKEFKAWVKASQPQADQSFRKKNLKISR